MAVFGLNYPLPARELGGKLPLYRGRSAQEEAAPSGPACLDSYPAPDSTIVATASHLSPLANGKPTGSHPVVGGDGRRTRLENPTHPAAPNDEAEAVRGRLRHGVPGVAS